MIYIISLRKIENNYFFFFSINAFLKWSKSSKKTNYKNEFNYKNNRNEWKNID